MIYLFKKQMNHFNKKSVKMNHFNKKSVKELMKDQSKGKTLTPYEREQVKEEAIKNRQRNKTKPKR